MVVVESIDVDDAMRPMVVPRSHRGVDVEFAPMAKLVVGVNQLPTPPLAEAESVVPSQVRFEPMTTDFTGPNPLPARMPPREVEEPVPAYAIPRLDVPITCPFRSVVRSAERVRVPLI